MKKIFPILILFLLAMLIWNLFVGHGDYAFNIDGDHFDGPLGALAALLFAGGGMLIGGVVMVFVGVVLALVFAGVGILVVSALALAALVVAVAVSPLLLPLLLPLALIWFFVNRGRRTRAKAEAI
ncbi:MAG TPA: hypothetical protein VFG03_04355 [Telluria sp.]|nr:hypothetical protein [Telluria sp.]